MANSSTGFLWFKVMSSTGFLGGRSVTSDCRCDCGSKRTREGSRQIAPLHSRCFLHICNCCIHVIVQIPPKMSFRPQHKWSFLTRLFCFYIFFCKTSLVFVTFACCLWNDWKTCGKIWMRISWDWEKWRSLDAASFATVFLCYFTLH